MAETIDESNDENGVIINFITHVEVQDATAHDSTAAIPYLEDQKANEIAPSEVYGDAHYNSSDNIKSFAEASVELKGPVVPVPTKGRLRKRIGGS